MSTEKLWGAPRIHGELLKLGFSVAQSSVAKYMVKRRGPPRWKGSPMWTTENRGARQGLGENFNQKALAFLRLASIRLMLRKLCNPA